MAFSTISRSPPSPAPCQCHCTLRAPVAARPAIHRKRVAWTAAVAEGRNASSVAELKQAIIEQAGDRGGLDRTDAQKKAVEELVDRLESAGSVQDVDLTGTVWRPVFTTSTTESAGKLGPFTGRVRQEFPADMRGQYLNNVDFGGILQAKLLGNYEKNGQRVNLVFLWTEFSLGPFRFKKDFPPNFKGHWNLKYVDPEMRVFSTNKGNIFVLLKVNE